MQPGYETIFEIGWRSFPWSGLVHPIPFIILGILLIGFSKSKQIYKVFGVALATLATVIFLFLAQSYLPDFIHLRGIYRSGGSTVVVGTVENFHPAPTLGAANESFSVNGINFTYNVLENTPCFYNAPAHRGPIRPGLEVRIYYNDRCIQRVDIRQSR